MPKDRDRALRREETPVDDVRRVRERLDREAGGDVHRLAEAARQAAEQYREKLGLKIVAPTAKPR